MKKILFVLACSLLAIAQSQAQTVPIMKKMLDTTSDPIGMTKYLFRKKYKIDTVTIYSTTSFLGFADSIAYRGKVGKVYGPFNKKNNYLLKILGKVPNTFYHVSHILIDTSVFKPKFADSLANSIIAKIKGGTDDFKSMASTYSSDPMSSSKGGDLGWFIRGVMLPQLDDAIANHKKGDVFKVWTAAGLHVVTINDLPKSDNGFALILRVFL